MAVTWHVDMKVAVSTAMVAAIDAASGAAYFVIEDADNVVLSTLPLADPCGSVNSGTGRLTLTPGARDEEAAASGTPHHAKLCGGAGKVWMTCDCVGGPSSVTDSLVVFPSAIVQGAPVELLSATFG